MLFGTAKRLSMNPDNLTLSYRGNQINFAKRYKYLGTTLDPALILRENFDKSYKKASSRLRLMSHLRCNLTTKAAIQVYSMMISPLLKYNSIVNLNFNKTQLNKLKSVDNRAKQIINDQTFCQSSCINSINGHACLLVRKCLDQNICSNFLNYFTINQTVKVTRNNSTFLTLPKVKLNTARDGFFFMGAKIYNSLPLDIRNEENFSTFKEKIRNHNF